MDAATVILIVKEAWQIGVLPKILKVFGGLFGGKREANNNKKKTV